MKFLKIIVACAAIAATSVQIAAQEASIAHGEYLVNGITGCGNYHTPLDENGRETDEILSGRLLEDIEPFTAYAANITPDFKTGIGA